MLIPLQNPSTPGMSEICAFTIFQFERIFVCIDEGYARIEKWKIIQRNNPLISVLKCSIHLLSVNRNLVMTFKFQIHRQMQV